MTTVQAATKAKDLIRRICEQMILKPDRLKLDVMPMTNSFVVYVVAGYSDAKRIVGSKGVHFEALKILTGLLGKKHGFSGKLDSIQDDGNPQEDRYADFVPSSDWPKAKVQKLVEDICEACLSEPARVTIQDGQNGMSVIEIFTADDEAKETVESLSLALIYLVKPIGKGNQRRLMVNVIAETSGEKQPASADGRFAKAISR